MNLKRFLVASLAIYSLSRLLAFEDGFPLPIGKESNRHVGVFKRLRFWSKDALGDDHAVTKGLACPMCLAFWLSIPATAWMNTSEHRVMDFVYVALAMRGLVAIMVRYFG